MRYRRLAGKKEEKVARARAETVGKNRGIVSLRGSRGGSRPRVYFDKSDAATNDAKSSSDTRVSS